MFDKEKILPFFPLNISLLPGEDIPLRIFEPRYKQLINECIGERRNFGIPFIRNAEIQPFGIECKVKKLVARNLRGEMVIVIVGISNFEVKSYNQILPGKLYGGGTIYPISDDRPVCRDKLRKLLIYYIKNHDADFMKDITGREIRIYDVARALNLSSDDKFRFISIKDPDRKENFLIAQILYLSKIREQEKLLNNDYMQN
jgi:hypothetical protein